MHGLLFALIGLASPFNHYQADTLRSLLARPGTPPWVVALDAVQAPTIAFTDMEAKKIYIDGARLAATPTTFYNVAVHEYGHAALGLEHDPVPIPGSIMSYAVLLSPNGTVQEDTRRLTLPPGPPTPQVLTAHQLGAPIYPASPPLCPTSHSRPS